MKLSLCDGRRDNLNNTSLAFLKRKRSLICNSKLLPDKPSFNFLIDLRKSCPTNLSIDLDTMPDPGIPDDPDLNSRMEYLFEEYLKIEQSIKDDKQKETISKSRSASLNDIFGASKKKEIINPKTTGNSKSKLQSYGLRSPLPLRRCPGSEVNRVCSWKTSPVSRGVEMKDTPPPNKCFREANKLSCRLNLIRKVDVFICPEARNEQRFTVPSEQLIETKYTKDNGELLNVQVDSEVASQSQVSNKDENVSVEFKETHCVTFLRRSRGSNNPGSNDKLSHEKETMVKSRSYRNSQPSPSSCANNRNSKIPIPARDPSITKILFKV